MAFFCKYSSEKPDTRTKACGWLADSKLDLRKPFVNRQASTYYLYVTSSSSSILAVPCSGVSYCIAIMYTIASLKPAPERNVSLRACKSKLFSVAAIHGRKPVRSVVQDEAWSFGCLHGTLVVAVCGRLFSCIDCTLGPSAEQEAMGLGGGQDACLCILYDKWKSSS